ncbi:hypothetical protein AB1Y20_021661 [Prymnesium parvum]|uniref:Agenet-like domain-containing protein n=1 Tax=Prymnesium parvum TaxID=97485 RepID=A0AB34JMU5_PRYPA
MARSSGAAAVPPPTPPNAPHSKRKRDGSPVAAAVGSSFRLKEDPIPPSVHCYTPGDAVEGLLTEGFWVPAQVIIAKARSIFVRYERRDDELAPSPSGAHYRSRCDETAGKIAKWLGIPLSFLLKQNAHIEALTGSSKLRVGTLLDLPRLHTTGDGESLRLLAERYKRDVEDMVEFNRGALDELPLDLEADTTLPTGIVVGLPARTIDAQAAAEAEDMHLPPPLLSPLEVFIGGVGVRKSWKPAECRKLMGNRAFEVVVDGNESRRLQCKMAQRGETWRTLSQSSRQEVSSGSEMPAVGETVEVEVQDELGKFRWRVATVRAKVDDASFVVCVDGDEDFLETYGMHEEGKEWRRPPPLDPDDCTTERLVPAHIRPPPPCTPATFRAALRPGLMVQVRQDGGWWRAVVQEMLPAGVDGDAPCAGSEQLPTVVVMLYEKAGAPALRVRDGYLRPDWCWQADGSDGSWKMEMSLTTEPSAESADLAAASPAAAAAEATGDEQSVRSSREEEAPPPRDVEGPGCAQWALVLKQWRGKTFLTDGMVDHRLWRGAYESGWRVVEANFDGQRVTSWKYLAPWGEVLRNRTQCADAAGKALTRPRLRKLDEAAPSPAPAEATASPATTDARPSRLFGWLVADEQAWGCTRPVLAQVEVRLAEIAFRHAWWEGRVVSRDPRGAMVKILAFASEQEEEERLTEWVPWARLRPKPPPAPSDFLNASREGDAVEVWYEDAWWEAVLVNAEPTDEELASLDPTARLPPPASSAASDPMAATAEGGSSCSTACAEQGAKCELALAASAPAAAASSAPSASASTLSCDAPASGVQCGQGDGSPAAQMAIITRCARVARQCAVPHAQLRPGWRWTATADYSEGWTAPCIEPVYEPEQLDYLEPK